MLFVFGWCIIGAYPPPSGNAVCRVHKPQPINHMTISNTFKNLFYTLHASIDLVKTIRTMAPAGDKTMYVKAYTDEDGDIEVSATYTTDSKGKMYPAGILTVDGHSISAEDVETFESYGYRTRYYTRIVLNNGREIEFFLK